MRKYKTIVLFILALINTCYAHAYTPQSGNITGTFGPYWSTTDYPSSKTENYAPVLTGFSIVANGDTGTRGSLEVAMIYAPRLYFREENSLVQLEKIYRIHISMGYRWWLGSYFSTSLGLASSYAIGDPTVEYTQYAPGTAIDTSASDITEYGVDVAVQAQLWGNDKFDVVTEARYTYALTPKENEKSHHYGLSIGIRYLFQGSEEKPVPEPEEQVKKEKSVSKSDAQDP